MSGSDWRGLIRGLFKFLMEEAREPEHQGQDAPKLSKSEVDYGPGEKAAHCSICVHFQEPHSCELVEGEISPDGWCKRFLASQTRLGQDEQPKGRAASVAFVTPDGKCLFVKRGDGEENFPGHWAFPGGKAEDGEEPEACAIRETREELGKDCSFDGMRVLRGPYRTPFGWDHMTFAVPVKDAFEPKLNDEHSAHVWAPVTAPPAPLHPGVKATIDAVLAKAAKDVADPSGKLSATTREQVNSPEHREDMPDDAFLGPNKTYPVKEERDGKWQYTRNLLLAAARRARMQGRGDIAKRADAIRDREFDAGGEDDWEEAKHPRGQRGQFSSGGGGSLPPHNPTILNKPTPKSFWSYQASSPTPSIHDLPEGTFKGTQREWESLSPGMRREIARQASQKAQDGALKTIDYDWRAGVSRSVSGRATGMALDRALDRAGASARTFDADGRMHVDEANISKATVNPYWGREINSVMNGTPGWQSLDPDRKYHLLRDPDELKKAVKTFNGLPILSRHVPISADAHKPELVIGSTGTDAEFEKPYLKNSLVFWPRSAIDKIEDGVEKQLSAAYKYVADMTPGTYEGRHYDGIMRQIIGNHVALVPEGRAGPDVAVGDSALSVGAFGGFLWNTVRP